MDNQNQNNDDFSEGFLIKDKSGQLKKVQDDKVVDFKSSAPPSPPKVANAPVKKQDKVSVAPLPIIKPKEEITTSDQAEKSRPAAWPVSPPAPVSPSSKADYIIEPEDEEEIKKHGEELKKMVTAAPPDLPTAMSTVINNVIGRHNLRFDDEIKKKRFFTVIESRLKNIRDSIETEEVLIRASKVGGLELAPEIAKNIISAVEEEANKLPELKLKEEPLLEEKKVTSALKDITSETEQVLKESDSMLAPAPPAFIPRPKVSAEEEKKEVISPQSEKAIAEEELAKPEEKIVIEEKKPEPPVESAVKPTPSEEPREIPFKKQAPPVSQSVSTPSVAQPVEELYQRSPEDEMAKMARIRKPEPQRPQVVDIKRPVVAVGPVEELAEIDLKELRRLGTNPKDAAEKILEKVYLLEEESWKIRMDGIKAWQSSPVHHLYLETGRQSIESGKTVEEAIQMLANEKKPHLLIEEFFAINDLNSKLIA
jgi:hypothetical protein